MLVRLATLACLSAPILAQQGAPAAEPTLPPHQSLISSGVDTPAPACPRFDNRERPVNTAIQARVTELMDSSRLKPGDTVFAKVLYEITYAGCELAPEAIVYGHVTAAFASKNPKSSELGLVFDHADCTGNQKQQLHLRLVGLVAPPDHTVMEHDVLPSQVRGGVQTLPSTSRRGVDDNLDPAIYPQTVQPGLVVRMPKVKLDPEGAPECSARISSSNRDLRVAPGAELILTVETLTQASPATP
jgi:hypothetical protein